MSDSGSNSVGFQPYIIRPSAHSTSSALLKPGRTPCTQFISKFLRNPASQWGFFIVRTVYTPESDAQFATFLELLKVALTNDIESEARSPARAIEFYQAADMAKEQVEAFKADTEKGSEGPWPTGFTREPVEKVLEKMQFVVRNGKEFDGLGAEEVREVFDKWVTAKKNERMEKKKAGDRSVGVAVSEDVCLWVDEDVLKSAMRWGDDIRDEAKFKEEELRNSYRPEGFKKRKKAFVKVVERSKGNVGCRVGYEGWMRKSLESLWDFYRSDVRFGTGLVERRSIPGKSANGEDGWEDE
ncbi:hypothetical protein BJ508DRAFT_365301 [Ascobolus immersus RN42]|uniref:Uncharacterized protein n=1 Tax=Ascobolus immersus RN42 TaxID=1160509 RepID=A0A3N4HQ86_ASCIM|nr:hypothetical protein BJ508DRAFT_365301 [Ascobolus immersus RN42]